MAIFKERKKNLDEKHYRKDLSTTFIGLIIVMAQQMARHLNCLEFLNQNWTQRLQLHWKFIE